MQDYAAFTDGNPLLELLIFLIILLLFTYVVQWKRTENFLNRASSALFHLVQSRNALPIGSVEFELLKLDVFRIAVGGIVTLRYGSIFLGAVEAGNHISILLSGAATIAALCVTVGLFTRFASVCLMASANTIIDNYLGASTLGTMVMSMVLLVFAIAPAGRTMSLDALIYGRRGASIENVVIAKLAGLVAYYCVCLYSVFWHTHDQAWTSLNVIGWVLLSPAANPNFSETAWAIYEWSPWLFITFAKLSIVGMFAWYALVLPGLFLHRFTRWFVIFWGLTFFLISTFVLPLSYLGWYELCLWGILFFPPMWNGRNTPAIQQKPAKMDQLSGALVLTLGVLAFAFVVRLPIVNAEPDSVAPASWSKQVIGAAPAAFGIHKINVFNQEDLSLFSYRWENYLYPEGADIASVDYNALDPATGGAASFTDDIRYGIVRHSRRAARENLGCDREYFEAIAPYVQAMYAGKVPPDRSLISTRWVLRQPAAGDFARFAFVDHAEFPLCGALIQPSEAQVKELVFVQSGVDEKLRQLGFPPILDSKNVEAALQYDCGDGGRFLWGLASNRLEQQDPALIASVQSVTADVFGRFEIECLMEVREITEKLPQLLSDDYVPLEGTCAAGIGLLESLAAASKFTPEIYLDGYLSKATAAKATGNFQSCISYALGGRAAYWDAITLETS